MVVVALIAGSLGLAAPAFADPSVPDAPTNARALPGEDAGVFVTADVPADHGDPIVSYTATCDSSNGGPSGSHSDNAPNIFVPLLVNGFTYTCTMTATNGQGESAP